MKRTSEDDEYAPEFGRRLKAHYDIARMEPPTGKGLSDEEFAATLDITRPALRKYLNGRAMPTLRTVVLAFRVYGIAVPYFGVPLFRTRRQVHKSAGVTQLVLPFSVRGLGSFGVQARIAPRGENKFELRVDVESAV
jgi:transcriptional regulator with XRE-family HTH domain